MNRKFDEYNIYTEITSIKLTWPVKCLSIDNFCTNAIMILNEKKIPQRKKMKRKFFPLDQRPIEHGTEAKRVCGYVILSILNLKCHTRNVKRSVYC